MVRTDLSDGGRWTSLVLADREWLWTNPSTGPRSGSSTYVDSGGLDECFPTIRGTPDHGALWNQPWSADTVQHEAARLVRRITEAGDSRVVADYRLTAPAGYRFIWAAHALLDVGVGSTITVPDGTVCRLYPDDTWTETSWPCGLETYGETDGTAVGAVLLDCPRAVVRDGGHELTFEVSCPGQPVGTAVWRNLGGFPANAPYRSLGVEPILGRVFDLAEAGPGDAAVVPASGELAWRLEISAGPIR